MFFRTLLFVLLGVVAITFIRMFAGILTKGLGGMFQPPSSTNAAGRQRQPSPGGELLRDPVCGAFVAAESSVSKTVGGQVVHFCSEQCRDKYNSAATGAS